MSVNYSQQLRTSSFSGIANDQDSCLLSLTLKILAFYDACLLNHGFFNVLPRGFVGDAAYGGCNAVILHL